MACLIDNRMSIVYTDLGLMDRQIDIWDQPAVLSDGSTPAPVLFAQGVFAYITGLWATTQARKLQQQVISEVTHRIIIRYMAGLRSRMFILYNDPDSKDDNGVLVPRRFDIDRIFDIDEHKVELWIMAVERNEGR